MATVQKTEAVNAMKDGQAQTAASKGTPFMIFPVLTQCSKYTMSYNTEFETSTVIFCREGVPGVQPC